MNSIVITRYNNRIMCGYFEDYKLLECDFNPDEDVNVSIGDIYIGVVDNIVSNLNCAFVRFQKDLIGYYPLESNKHIFLNPKNDDKIHIGDRILVQVEKEPIKTKPYTLTSNISIHGRYCVACSDTKDIMVSKKISNPVKNELKCRLEEHLAEKYEYGLIVRTNAKDAELGVVKDEAVRLLDKLTSVLNLAKHQTKYSKLYSGSPFYIEFINSFSSNLVDKITTDIDEIYTTMNSMRIPCTLYKDEQLELVHLYNIDKQIERALNKRVWLDCGGYLIIEPTESLTAVDVNSGKFQPSKRADRRASILKVNIEAAQELSKQLKLRNISGMIIVDFINMDNDNDNTELIKELKKCLATDRIGANFVDKTSLGLIEITRKKVKRPLYQILHNGGNIVHE